MDLIKQKFLAAASLLIALSVSLSQSANVAIACQSPVGATPIEIGEPIGVNDSVSIESAGFPAPVSMQDPTQVSQPSDSSAADQLVSSETLESLLGGESDSLTSPESLPSSIKLAVVLGVLSLAPAIILMTTCYVRVIVVLTLLRQAFGVQQMPPTQVLTALSLFVTLLVMAPVWHQIKTDAIDPYTRAENPISWEQAWDKGVTPVKTFMLKQIQLAGNEDSVAVFYENLPQESLSSASELPTSLEEVPIRIVLPAFLISELKVAFLLGFQIYLPFLILDLVVSSVTVSMGMVMLPPTMVSFPLKLILFVMVDGWNLVLGMLLQSFG